MLGKAAALRPPRNGENCRRGMVPGPTNSVAAASPRDNSEEERLVLRSAGFFEKDGRKIQVGDCALFQAGDAPPFIGIIRWISAYADGSPKLGVNWLYRPVDVKLAKGSLLEAAPNEVFYSFHRDEIPAGSLLHPCKVAFLRKGVELPSGLPSFVCRRVYDIENKCLWWLTDQDYVNERQEEVNQLLDKTQLEMHALQSGGRSPKNLNDPPSSQQLKSGSDSVENSGTPTPVQVKGKKRDRGDQGTESVKRERNSKLDASDSSRLEMIRAEIAKIMTEKGGLASVESVEKLLHLMQVDRPDRKSDVASKVLLADVIAATDRLDCLGRFVQLRGVPIFDDWLQDVHKGKSGNSGSPREGDKSIEELLVALLRALDKLPVNLHALQTCNIGKSVNYLRTHKNPDIQKKARSLVDTWKKRVDAEIARIDDAKSVGSYQATSSPSKSGFSEVSHGGSRQPSSTDAVLKSSIVQPSSCKAAVAGKPGSSENTRVLPVTPVALKLQSHLPSTIDVSSEDSSGRPLGGSGTPDIPMVAAKEEKIHNSGHYQNNSQSSSTDPSKVISPSLKEDAKTAASLSMNSSKMAGVSSRHRRSSNGFVAAPTVPGVQREMSTGKPSSIGRTLIGDKVSQTASTSERTVDTPSADNSNSYRLIVRLSNPGHSPGRTANADSSDDPSVLRLKASSPGDADKEDQDDHKIKEKTEVSKTGDVNTETWQGNGVKGLAATDEVEQSQGASRYEESCRVPDEAGKTGESSEGTCSSAGNEKEVALEETRTRNSLNSISALIESCATYSEACPPLLANDDTGMNLLASVATGEMSNLASPAESPVFTPTTDDSHQDNNRGQLRSAVDDAQPQNENHTTEFSGGDSIKDGQRSTPRADEDGLQTASMVKEDKLAGVEIEQLPCSATSLQNTTLQCLKPHGKVEEGEISDCTMSSAPTENKPGIEGEAIHPPKSRQKAGEERSNLGTNCKQQETGLLSDDKKKIGSIKEEDTDASGRKHEMVSWNKNVKKNHVNDVGSHAASPSEDKKATGEVDVKTTGRSEDATSCSYVDNAVHLDKANSIKGEMPESPVVSSYSGTSHSDKKVRRFVIQTVDNLGNGLEEASKLRKSFAQISPVAASCGDAVTPTDDVSRKQELSHSSAEDKMGLSSSVSPEVCPAVVDGASMLVIDLNEGFTGDYNQAEPVYSAMEMHSPLVPLHSLPRLAASQLSSVLPAPITVAAPAKGPFVPPANLLKNKAEPGWKGSAATSAFRPAEPRKGLEMPLNAPDVPSSDSTPAKQVRPALDIDLNVPDDRVLEDITLQCSSHSVAAKPGTISDSYLPVKSGGGLDLDLNRVDESIDNSQFLANNSHRVEVPLIPLRPVPGGLPNVDSSVRRGFDLNGPVFDEVCVETAIRSQHAKTSNVPSVSPFAGIRMSNAEVGNMTSWFPPGDSYPAVAIPSFLRDRGEQPYSVIPAAGSQRVLVPTATDIYRSPVLSSSPSMAFSHATAFPYARYPFGSAFPLASSSFSGCSSSYVDSSPGGGPYFTTIPSQLVGPAGTVSSPFIRPCVMSVPEGSASGGSESTLKRDRQGLDLNAGPGSADVENERLVSTMRQLPVAASQSFADERARIYQVIGGGLKRKEPDGGWEAEKFVYKQPSWQ